MEDKEYRVKHLTALDNIKQLLLGILVVLICIELILMLN